jgi:homoserine kinase
MIRVFVPATSANCSIGFDTLGMALDWMAMFEFDFSDHLVISGCPQAFCNPDNLVYQAYKKTCEKYGCEVKDVRIHIDSSIPFARGLGSSSVCTVAGILGASALHHLDLDQDQVLAVATEMEGHPDNVAPAIFGQMCACFTDHEGNVVHEILDMADWKVLAIIPNYEVSTNEARKVLPEEVPLKKAAAQVGRALVFEKALAAGDERKLALCCSDIFHEPYRSQLISEYYPIQSYARANQLPFWISGSGSTMLIMALEKDTLETLERNIRQVWPHLDTKILNVCRHGAAVVSS